MSKPNDTVDAVTGIDGVEQTRLPGVQPPPPVDRPLLDPETLKLRLSTAREAEQQPRTARPAGAPAPLGPPAGQGGRGAPHLPRLRPTVGPAVHGMDVKDYFQIFRRGWPLLLAVILLGTASAGLYLAVAPRSYDSSTALFISANAPQTIGELQGGTEFSAQAVTSYADIVASATVLQPAARELGLALDDLQSRVSAIAPEQTRIIDVAASAGDPAEAARIANAVALSATRILPTLEGSPGGVPLISVTQLRTAVPPESPASPNSKQVLAIGTVIGICLGLGLTIARQTLDSRIRRPEEIRALTDVPTLAVLPPGRRVSNLVVRDEPAGSAGEAYRTLRANLGFLEAIGRRSLLFTGVADERDGARVPANLAWSLAQTGRRVLLVDLDLRGDTVASTMGLPNHPGLSDVLNGRSNLNSTILATDHPDVRVLPSGECIGSPSDLLSGPMMAGLLRRTEREHDYVILHAPSVLSSSDAAVVAAISGATFVTVGAGRTKAAELEAALNALGNVQVRPFGIALVQPRRAGLTAVGEVSAPSETVDRPGGSE